MSKKTITVTPPKRTPTLSECQEQIARLKSLLKMRVQIGKGNTILGGRHRIQLRREIEAIEAIIANGEYKDA